MESAFKERFLRNFIDFLQMFVERLQSMFPEDTEIQEVVTSLNPMEIETQKEIIESWNKSALKVILPK